MTGCALKKASLNILAIGRVVLDKFFGLLVFPLARFLQEQDENLPSSQKKNLIKIN